MKIHPREKIVTAASIDFGQFMVQLLKKHELTHGELFTLLAEQLTSSAKYAVREERRVKEPEERPSSDLEDTVVGGPVYKDYGNGGRWEGHKKG